MHVDWYVDRYRTTRTKYQLPIQNCHTVSKTGVLKIRHVCVSTHYAKHSSNIMKVCDENSCLTFM